MTEKERYLKKNLGQDIQVSEIVNERLKLTYDMLQKEQKNTLQRGTGIVRYRFAAAMTAVTLCVVSTAVYASVKGGFFQGMFGNETKQSSPYIEREIENGKGGKVKAVIPSKEYVDVDEERAQELLGDYVMDQPVVKQIKDHTLTVESFIYDQNGGLMYFTLEREGKVTALEFDEDSNITKGAWFSEDGDIDFHIIAGENVIGVQNIYVDTQLSTEDKLYCYSYILWTEQLEKGAVPQLEIETLPCSRKELNAMSSEELEKQEIPDPEYITLTDKGPVNMCTIDMGEQGELTYSPISIAVNMAKGMGLSKEEAEEPYYMKYMEIKYKDGTNYIISEQDKTENTGYIAGIGTWYKAMFSRC